MDTNQPITFTPEQLSYVLHYMHNTSPSPGTQHSSSSPSLGASVGTCPISNLAPASSSPPHFERTQFASTNYQIPSPYAISQSRQVDLQILLQDKTGMTEEQLRVHESMCRRIMAKYDD